MTDTERLHQRIDNWSRSFGAMREDLTALRLQVTNLEDSMKARKAHEDYHRAFPKSWKEIALEPELNAPVGPYRLQWVTLTESKCKAVRAVVPSNTSRPVNAYFYVDAHGCSTITFVREGDLLTARVTISEPQLSRACECLTRAQTDFDLRIGAGCSELKVSVLRKVIDAVNDYTQDHQYWEQCPKGHPPPQVKL